MKEPSAFVLFERTIFWARHWRTKGFYFQATRLADGTVRLTWGTTCPGMAKGRKARASSILLFDRDLWLRGDAGVRDKVAESLTKLQRSL